MASRLLRPPTLKHDLIRILRQHAGKIGIRMPSDRFPSPWRVTREEGSFCVVDRDGLVLARTSFVHGPGTPTTLSETEAHRLAVGFSSFPDLVRQLHVFNLARGSESEPAAEN